MSFDGKYRTSYLIAIVMFALYLAVCKIFAKQEKCLIFDLKTEGQGQEVEEGHLHRSTQNVRIQIGDLFQNFTYLPTYIYAKGKTHMYTRMNARTHERQAS